MLDVWHGSKYASVDFLEGNCFGFYYSGNKENS